MIQCLRPFCFKRDLVELKSLSQRLEVCLDMLKFVLEVISKEKNRLSEVGNFPRKGGGSLESLKYQAFPC